MISNNSKDVEQQGLSFIAGGKAVWQFPTKLSIVLPRDPATVLLGLYPSELKTCSHKNLHTNNSFIHNH